ncbi:MAG TPA: alpha/beta fold hydrolase [Candidatus Angelobacter sp.]
MPLLELQDATLHYELKGKGEPVLFIQGCGVTGSGWDMQVKELSSDFECLTFDNRGIGKSTNAAETLTVEQMAADARTLLDAVGWESAHVVGHSLGGVIAQQLALDAPERVKSLSLLCTFSKGAEGGRLTPSTVWMGLRTHLGTRRMRRHAFLQILFPQTFLDGLCPDRLAETLAPIIGRDLADSPSIMMQQVRALAAHDCTAQLHKLSPIPTLVVSAHEDRIALTHFGRLLCLHIDGARYVEIQGAGHGVIMQNPATISNLLREHFLRSSTQDAFAGPAQTHSPVLAKKRPAWPGAKWQAAAVGGVR